MSDNCTDLGLLCSPHWIVHENDGAKLKTVEDAMEVGVNIHSCLSACLSLE